MNWTFPAEPVNTVMPLSNDYTHSVELLKDGEFHVFWKYDETTIIFEVHAKTLGWVGFGLSSNGGMAGSDVTITWVKDGQTFFSVSIQLTPLNPNSFNWSLPLSLSL